MQNIFLLLAQKKDNVARSTIVETGYFLLKFLWLISLYH